jgi:hypothetical protein
LQTWHGVTPKIAPALFQVSSLAWLWLQTWHGVTPKIAPALFQVSLFRTWCVLVLLAQPPAIPKFTSLKIGSSSGAGVGPFSDKIFSSSRAGGGPVSISAGTWPFPASLAGGLSSSPAWPAGPQASVHPASPCVLLPHLTHQCLNLQALRAHPLAQL